MNKVADELFYKSFKDELNFNRRGYEASYDQIANQLGYHSNTIIKRFQNPEEFTLADVKRLVRMLNIKPTTMMNYLYGDIKQ